MSSLSSAPTPAESAQPADGVDLVSLLGAITAEASRAVLAEDVVISRDDDTLRLIDIHVPARPADGDRPRVDRVSETPRRQSPATELGLVADYIVANARHPDLEALRGTRSQRRPRPLAEAGG